MKIYLLIHEQDTHAAWGCDVKPFTNKQAAQKMMHKDWEATVENCEYDSREHHDEDECECREDEAIIRCGDDFESWRIEEHKLDVQVAVRVKGSLVEDVHANADVAVDVYDLDVSDFPDEGEQNEADKRNAELTELLKSPDWQNVW